jgi:8-oxo-dGTP pyrophosphatase MutT (NUDIX family)
MAESENQGYTETMNYQISVKAVVRDGTKVLLRKNDRAEYELPGGRMEEGESFEDTVRREISEESGVLISDLRPLEPWLYQIGNIRTVLIVPFSCRATSIPAEMVDQDGGTVHWLETDSLEKLNMPQGYRDNILSKSPHHSMSRIEFPPDVVQRSKLFKKPEYSTVVVLRTSGGQTHRQTDGDVAKKLIGAKFSEVARRVAAGMTMVDEIQFERVEIEGSEAKIVFSA